MFIEVLILGILIFVIFPTYCVICYLIKLYRCHKAIKDMELGDFDD